jgi:hypothetical protein
LKFANEFTKDELPIEKTESKEKEEEDQNADTDSINSMTVFQR